MRGGELSGYVHDKLQLAAAGPSAYLPTTFRRKRQAGCLKVAGITFPERGFDWWCVAIQSATTNFQLGADRLNPSQFHAGRLPAGLSPSKKPPVLAPEPPRAYRKPVPPRIRGNRLRIPDVRRDRAPSSRGGDNVFGKSHVNCAVRCWSGRGRRSRGLTFASARGQRQCHEQGELPHMKNQVSHV